MAGTALSTLESLARTLGEPDTTIADMADACTNLRGLSKSVKEPVIDRMMPGIRQLTAAERTHEIDEATLDDALDGDNGWLTDKFRTWSRTVNFCSESVEISEEIGKVMEKAGDGFRQDFQGLRNKLRTDQTLNISYDRKRQLERLDPDSPDFEANAKRLLGTIRHEFRSLIDMNVFKDWLKASEGLT